MNNSTQGMASLPGKSPKKESTSMKGLIFVIIIVVSSLFLFAMFNSYTDATSTTTEDSVTVEQTMDSLIESSYLEKSRLKDSLLKAKAAENQAIIGILKKNFRLKKDEFKEISWVYHKSTARYTNMNSVHLYFQLSEDGIPSNLRFCVQYEDDDWLFIKYMIFNIDGNNITFYPNNVERDCGNGGRIWEWCDEAAYMDKELISAISKAKKIKIKLEGEQYYDTKKMSATQLKAFKETLQYYVALGGDL